MAEESSRLNVEVDGTRAAGQIDKITAAFRRLEGAVSRNKTRFAALGRGASSAFASMRSAGSTAFRSLSTGFNVLRRSSQLFMSVFRTMLKVFLAAGAAFALFSRSVLDTGNQINKFVNTLVILKGGTAEAIAELRLLFELSNKLGTSFTAAAGPFTKFAAAAAGALTDSAIREVFESFATVGVALQLTQSEVTGVFLALQQIASKGVVSMEELRLQLAERVPGAMRLAAQAMDMSMRDFEKAVQERTINAGDFLEKFALKLKNVYGDAALIAADRLFADIQRLGNAFTAFKTEIFQSGFEEGLRDLVRSAAGFLNDNPELSNALGQFSKEIFTRVADFLDSLTADKVIGVLNQLIGALESVANAMLTVAFTMRKAFDSDFRGIVDTVTDYSRDLNKLIDERKEVTQRLSNTNVRETHMFTDDTFRPMNNREIIAADTRLTTIVTDIEVMRALLVGARTEAKALGIELGSIPEDIFERLPQSAVGVSRPTLNIPRIEPVVSGRGSPLLDVLDTAEQDRKMTGDMQDALGTAERISTIGMPEFYKAMVTGEVREGMMELATVTMDLNALNVTQAETLKLIAERHLEVANMRALGEMDDTLIDSAILNDLTRDLTALTESYLEVEEDRLELKKDQLKLMDEEKKKLEELTSFQRTLEESFTSVQDVAINMTKSIEDAFVKMLQTGKASFGDLADSIVADLTRMAIQAFLTRFIMGPILGMASNALGNAFGATFATDNAIVTAPGTGGPTSHSGGIAGMESSGHRSFSQLKQDEMSIVVQKGEGVFTKEQMKAMAPISSMAASAGSNQGSMSPPIVNIRMPQNKVEIINNSGEEAAVDTTRSPDGSELTRVIIGAVGENIARDGDLSRLLRGKYGLKNRTGLR